MKELSFFVPGDPVGKARPRVSVRFGHAHAYTPAKTAAYEKTVATYAKAAMIAQKFEKVGKPAAVQLQIRAGFSVPKSWTKKKRAEALTGNLPHIVKPDADNLAKAILDALNEVIYADDSQVTVCHVEKVYADAPGVTVRVSTVG